MGRTRSEILERIRPDLVRLEEQRIEVRRRRKKTDQTIVFIAFAAPTIVLFSTSLGLSPLLAIWVALLIFFRALFYLLRDNAAVELQIQQVLGTCIMRACDKDWRYQAHKYIPEHQFKHVGLFPYFDRLVGEGLTTGEYEKTPFAFSFMRLDRIGSKDDIGIFKGLLLRIETGSNIDGKTLVFPDKAQRMLGTRWGKKLQGYGYKGLELIYLEDPIFEKIFVVYSTDQINGRMNLTPQMMDRLVQLKKSYSTMLSMAFTKGVIYIAIDRVLPFQSDLTMPISVTDSYDQFTRPIELVTSIIDQLVGRNNIQTKH